jgi:hypothetical protein
LESLRKPVDFPGACLIPEGQLSALASADSFHLAEPQAEAALARPRRQPVRKKTPRAGVTGRTATPAHLLVQRRRSAKQWLPHARIRYEETKNPIFVWEAYLAARSARLPLPAFVLEYFDRVGLRFASMSRQETPRPYSGPERRSGPTRIRRTTNFGPERRREAITDLFGEDHPSSFTRPSKGDIATVVYRALEFKPAGKWRGPENPFRPTGETSHEVEIGVSVLFKRRQGHTLDVAVDSVAREHPSHCDLDPPCARISRSTVARLWKKYGEKLWKDV